MTSLGVSAHFFQRGIYDENVTYDDFFLILILKVAVGSSNKERTSEK